jgi:hypothetical protein
MLERGAAVWTLTDGLGPSAAPAVGALSLLGEPTPNAALTGLEIEDGWPLPDIAVAVEVSNFLGRPAVLQVAAAGGVEPWTASEQLAEGETRRVQMSLRRRDGGRVDIRLADHRDALAADDAVVLHVPPPAAPDIAVLVDDAAGPHGRREIEAAAAALAAETGGRVVAAQPGSRAGFLLVEGGILPQAPPRALTFGTRRSSGELARDAVVLGPQVVDWDRADPLTRGLDLSELRVAHCLRHDFLGFGKPVLHGAHGPMVTVDEHGDEASVHAAFRLADSNFGRLPAFPQFVRRAFARAFGGRAAPALDPGNLLSAAESRLVRDAGAAPPADRGLPELGSPGRGLAAPLLLLALAALVVRLYT